jgi:FixJ family two-component response regulator
MIYLIDDDQYVRRGLGMLLESAAIECLSLGSAEEFLNNYKPADHDMLILDMHMPGMDGCGLLKHLYDNKMSIPVIIITGYDETSSRDCAKKYGAIAYLRKPIDGQALIDLVRYSINYA